MKYHNYYTVSLGKETHTAYNTIAADFWQKAAAFTCWAKFIALTARDGTRTFAPATLSSINCDVSRGGALKAVYSAELKTEIKPYVNVFVSAAEKSEYVMSRAAIDLTGTGETATVNFTVYLETEEGDGISFCSGDNALVRRLLGAGEEGEYALAWGECDYPARPCVRTNALVGEKLDTSVDYVSNSMRFASHSPAYGKEIILYHGAKSVLRAVRPYKTVLYSRSCVADDSSAVIASNADSVSAVTVGGVRMSISDTKRVALEAVTAVADKVLKLGLDGEVKSDAGEEYVAFITTGFVEVYKADALDLRRVFRVEKTNEYAEVLRGGALALWSDTALTIYEPDENGVYTSFTADISGTDNLFVVREGDRYQCAYRKGSALYRYIVTRTSAVNKTQTRITTNRFLLGRCGDAIAYGSGNVYVRMCDTDLTSDFACTVVSERTLPRTDAGRGDGFFFCEEEGVTHFYDYVHNTEKAMDAGLRASGRLVYGGDKAYVFNYKDGLRELAGDYDTRGASSACIAANAMFVLRDGNLYAYYLSGTDLSVRIPAKSEGKTVSYTSREREYEGSGSAVAFTLGGA